MLTPREPFVPPRFSNVDHLITKQISKQRDNFSNLTKNTAETKNKYYCLYDKSGKRA